jgi:hypothetical protein
MFQGTSLREIVIPNAVEMIDLSVFKDATELVNVAIDPKNSRLFRIRESAFENTKIWEIHCPASLRRLGLNAFAGCKNLQEFTVPDNSRLEKLKTVFAESGVKKLVLPGITVIRAGAFDHCPELKVVHFTTPTQNSIQRGRRIAMPDNLFHGLHARIVYPRGALRQGRTALRDNYGFF